MHDGCTCNPRTLIQKAFQGETDYPDCAIHRRDQGSPAAPIALNNDHALAAQLGMSLANKEH